MKIRTAGLILMMLLLLQQGFGQSAIIDNIFTLYGQLKGTHVDSVLIYYKSNGKNTFQARLIFNDRFIVTDSLTKPTYAIILFKNMGEAITDSAFESRSREIYLEPGRLYLTGDPTQLDSLKLTGSQSEDEWKELNTRTKGIRAEMKPLTDKYNQEKDPEKAAEISTQFEPYEDRIKAISYQFFLTYPNSYVTAHELAYYVTREGLDSTKRIYDNFNDELKQSDDGIAVEEEIKKMEAALPGNMAVDFTVADTAGKAIALADYKGKYVLLDFWASWCPPCRESNSHLVDLYKKYQGKGLNIIGIAWDDDTKEAWKKAMKKDKLTLWPNVLCGVGTDNDIGEKYAIHFVPTRILINPDGKIIGRFGDNDSHADLLLDRQLVAIFKE
ncbi:MAG TPA: TlpA disulfide reductase family protein [Mucilaginibacter sp.]|nr:TlpA disulfide reductase family protein [Mucilaginibacter sp.]